MMGACWFESSASGVSAEEAFRIARDRAAWEYGHGGYTGTIAEKDSFAMASKAPMTSREAEAMIQSIDDDHRLSWVFDKWGAAGCIQICDSVVEGEDASKVSKKRQFLFFGMASS